MHRHMEFFMLCHLAILTLTIQPLHPWSQMQPYPERGWRAEAFPSTGQGRDGEEGDRANGMWWPEDYLCGVPWLPRWSWARLGRWEQHPQWPHSHLCCWDRGPRPTRGRREWDVLVAFWMWMSNTVCMQLYSISGLLAGVLSSKRLSKGLT